MLFHPACNGESLRIAQDNLNAKNFYAFNPSFDKCCNPPDVVRTPSAKPVPTPARDCCCQQPMMPDCGCQQPMPKPDCCCKPEQKPDCGCKPPEHIPTPIPSCGCMPPMMPDCGCHQPMPKPDCGCKPEHKPTTLPSYECMPPMMPDCDYYPPAPMPDCGCTPEPEHKPMPIAPTSDKSGRGMFGCNIPATPTVKPCGYQNPSPYYGNPNMKRSCGCG